MNRGTKDNGARKEEQHPPQMDIENGFGKGPAGTTASTAITKSTHTKQRTRSSLTAHDHSKDDASSSVASTNTNTTSSRLLGWMAKALPFLVLILGLGTTAAFLGFGIPSTLDYQQRTFARDASDIVTRLQSKWDDYVHAALMVHQHCRDRTFTRTDFTDLYEYLLAQGLEFKAVQFDPNVSAAERLEFEASARQYYAEHYPHIDYQGFRGFNTDNSTTLEPRTEQPFYFPIHFMEPIIGNEAAIDLDYYSSIVRRNTVNAVFATGAPAITSRLTLVKDDQSKSRCGAYDIDAYGIVLMHPGVNVTSQRDVWPRDFASIVLCMPALLQRSLTTTSAAAVAATRRILYVHDVTDNVTRPDFLGAYQVQDNIKTFLPEIPFYDCDIQDDCFRRTIGVANRQWTVTVQDVNNRVDERLVYVIVAGSLICVATLLLAGLVYLNYQRIARISRLQAENEAEKASLILSHARQAAAQERELNDFIAHEVRNPVAAAMAACSFVKVAADQPSLSASDDMERLREDVKVVDNSLKFINDLLRNLLDMHRAANAQLVVDLAPTNVLHDVLEPVQGMMYQRDDKIEIKVDCPSNDILVMTDSLRLKQIMLNLGRNSTKFVSSGFIRFSACVNDDGCIQLAVEDSGPGIPVEKRKRLFSKFQESLDVLSQGTVSAMSV